MLAAGIMATACTRVEDAPSSNVDLAPVRALDSAYAAAWLSNDPEQVIALFTTDAVISPSGIPAIGGHEAMRAFWWPPDAPATKVNRFDLHQKWADRSGDMGVIRGTFELSFDYDGEPYSATGDYVAIMIRSDDGEWRMRLRAWNDLPKGSS